MNASEYNNFRSTNFGNEIMNDIELNAYDNLRSNTNDNNGSEKIDNNSIGRNWTSNNIMTLLSWIAISSFNIECLELAIQRYRKTVRTNVIIGLILSTAAGSVSIAQFGTVADNIRFYINLSFVLMSFCIAISSGAIKVYQIQERLEQFITIKQDWITFITSIATEMQLPVNLRKNALHLIKNYKIKYLDLLKIDNEIPKDIKRIVKKKFNQFKNERKENYHESLEIGKALSISDIILMMGYLEGVNLKTVSDDPNYTPNMEVNKFYDNLQKICLHRRNTVNKDTQYEQPIFINNYTSVRNDPIVCEVETNLTYDKTKLTNENIDFIKKIIDKGYNIKDIEELFIKIILNDNIINKITEETKENDSGYNKENYSEDNKENDSGYNKENYSEDNKENYSEDNKEKENSDVYIENNIFNQNILDLTNRGYTNKEAIKEAMMILFNKINKNN